MDTLSWLPSNCPPGIRIIVSATNPLFIERLRRKIQNPANLLRIDDFKEADAKAEISEILKSNNCKFIDTNLKELYDAISEERSKGIQITPLYVRMLTTHAITYAQEQRNKPFEMQQDGIGVLPKMLKEAFFHIITSAKKELGSYFVDATILFISVLDEGISECELLDVLFIDSEVIKEVIARRPDMPLDIIHEFISVNLQRFLLHYCSELLRWRFCDGKRLLVWNHDCFRNMVRDLEKNQNEERIQNVFSLLVEMFSEDNAVNHVDIKEGENIIIRMTPQISSSTNIRKMAVYTGLVAKTKCGLEFLKYNCLCNYKWLLIKIQACSVNNIILDYQHYISPDKSVDTMRDFFQQCIQSLKADHFALLPQIKGCLDKSYEEHDTLIDTIIEENEHYINSQTKSNFLLPSFTCFPSLSAPCKCKYWNIVHIISIDKFGKLSVVKTKEGYVEVWDLEIRDCVFSLTDDTDAPLVYDKSTPNVFTSGSQVMCFSTSIPSLDEEESSSSRGTMRIWDMECGAMITSMPFFDFRIHLATEERPEPKSALTISLFAFSVDFTIVAFHICDDDFNQVVLIVNTSEMMVISKVSGFDVKDEFPPNSAHFRNDNSILAYAKCRSEIDSSDKSADFSSVNLVNVETGEVEEMQMDLSTNDQHGKISAMITGQKSNTKNVILAWNNFTFNMYDVTNPQSFSVFKVDSSDQHLKLNLIEYKLNGNSLLAMAVICENIESHMQQVFGVWKWNIITGVCEKLLWQSLESNDVPRNFFTLGTSGLLLISSSADISIWQPEEDASRVISANSSRSTVDVEMGTCLHRIQAHTETIDAVKIVQEKALSFFTSSTGEGLVKFWNIRDVVEKAKLEQSSVETKDSQRDETSNRNPESDTEDEDENKAKISNYQKRARLKRQLKRRQLCSEYVSSNVEISKHSKYAVVGADKALPCVWRLDDCRVLGRLVLSQNELDLMNRRRTSSITTLSTISSTSRNTQLFAHWFKLACNDSVVVALCCQVNARKSLIYVYKTWSLATRQPLHEPQLHTSSVAAASLSDDKLQCILFCSRSICYEPGSREISPIHSSRNHHSCTEFTIRYIDILTNDVDRVVYLDCQVWPLEINMSDDEMYIIITKHIDYTQNNYHETGVCESQEKIHVFKVSEVADDIALPKIYDYKHGDCYKEYAAINTYILGNGMALSIGLNSDIQLWDIGHCEYETNLFNSTTWSCKTALSIVDDCRNPSLHNSDGHRTTCSCISLDCRYLVLGSSNGYLTYWDAEVEVLLENINAHKGAPVCSVCISDKHELIASASEDCTMALFKINASVVGQTSISQPGVELLSRLFTHVPLNIQFKFTPDHGRIIGVGCTKNERSRLMIIDVVTPT